MVTGMPSRASSMAEAKPPGPAPTMATWGDRADLSMSRQPSAVVKQWPSELDRTSLSTRGSDEGSRKGEIFPLKRINVIQAIRSEVKAPSRLLLRTFYNPEE